MPAYKFESLENFREFGQSGWGHGGKRVKPGSFYRCANPACMFLTHHISAYKLLVITPNDAKALRETYHINTWVCNWQLRNHSPNRSICVVAKKCAM